MSISREEYPVWLNRSCPKCGANVLTQADFNVIVSMEKILLNPVIKLLLYIGFCINPRRSYIKLHGQGLSTATITYDPPSTPVA